MATLRVAQRIRTRSDSLYADLYVYADEVEVDIANNRSRIQTSLGVYTSSSSYSYSTDGMSAGLTGSADGSWGHTSFSGQAYHELLSGSFWVTHNGDGTGTASVWWWFKTTFGNSFGTATHFDIGLSTIPRASVPSINTWPSNSPDITAGQACTIHMNKKANFTHKVTYGFGQKSGTIATSAVDNCSWTPPLDLLSQIPNSQTGQGTIWVETYNGSTKIGSTQACLFTLHVPSDSAPNLGTPTITENNAKVSAKGANITVQQISSKTIKATASSKYYSSIKSVTVDGVNMSAKDGTYSVTVGNLNGGKYTIVATDSRGLKTTKVVEQTFYSYFKPQITDVSLKRTSETGAEGTLKLDGKYSTTLSNTVKIEIMRNDASSYSILNATLSNGTVSASKGYSDLAYSAPWSIQIRITDSFGEVATTIAKLGVGQFAFAIGETGVVLGKESWIYDGQNNMRKFIDFFYPVGSFYDTTDENFNPNEIWGGKWEKVTDRMRIGAGNSYKSASTGGSTSHKHTTQGHAITIDEMPAHNHPFKGNTAGYSGGVAYTLHFGNGNPGTWDGYDGSLILNRGGNKAHSHGDTGTSSNLPPYYATYMWHRLS